VLKEVDEAASDVSDAWVSQYVERRPLHPEGRKLCSLDDLPKFKDIVGEGSRIPSDGFLALFFTQDYLERIEIQDAKKKLAELSAFERILTRCDPEAGFIIMDFSLRLSFMESPSDRPQS